jgi:hypothetical protein
MVTKRWAEQLMKRRWKWQMHHQCQNIGRRGRQDYRRLGNSVQFNITKTASGKKMDIDDNKQKQSARLAELKDVERNISDILEDTSNAADALEQPKP